MIIAIDGPSGTGKSTVAKGVAKRLKATFFDTGAMYRAAAWKILQEGIDPRDVARVSAFMPRFRFYIRRGVGEERSYFVGESDVTVLIRTPEVSAASSLIATYPEVRKAIVPMQRKFGEHSDAVFEGRDMGSVVFPDADLKVFLTARIEVRAERRYRELQLKFPDLSHSITQEQILKEIEERDRQDAERSISPLVQAPDAVLIDTSDLTIEQVIDRIVRLVPKSKRRFPAMKWSYALVYHLARLYFRLFFRLKVYGLSHFRPGAGLIAANHASFFDPPVLSISCPEEVHFLARDTLFHVPLLGSLIQKLNAHPVAHHVSDFQILREMIRLLGEGRKLILFPEGGRTPDGALQPFERGLAFLATKAGCPVFPAYLQGTFAAWPRTRKWPKMCGKIACVFGSPIEWEDFEGLPKKEAEAQLLKRVETAVKDLKAWLDQGAEGEPP